MNLLTALYRDDAGFVASAELVLVATIVVIGLIVGLCEVSTSVNHELKDCGSAFGAFNQSYSFGGHNSGSKSEGGSHRGR